MTSLHSELRLFRTLEGLSDAELQSLAVVVEVRTAHPGELIFREGDTSRELYLIRTGKIVITSQGDGGHTEHILAKLTDGDEFGELGFLDGSPRSATARAARRTEMVVLCRDKVEKLSDASSILDGAAKQIGVTSAERLKATNRNYVSSLQAQIETLKLQHDFGEFFIYIMACYAIGTTINVLLQSYLQHVDLYARSFSWSYLLVLLAPSLVIVWKQRIPLAQLGVTLRGWRTSMREGAIASGICAIIMVVALAVLRKTNWLTPPPITWAAASWLPSYFVHSAIQEFLARGIVQTAFRRFFGDERGLKSVLLASLLFSLFHVHFGLAAVAVTFVTSLFFGWFYLRHENLLGVSLLHGVAGSGAFLLGIL